MKDKKTVLISGCSTGIGRALTLEFLRRGYTVIATARKIKSLADLKDENIIKLTLDVTSDRSIKKCIRDSIKAAGRIDMLVNNAGYGLMGPSAEVPIDDFRIQMETNVTGLLALTQEVIPLMADRKRGTIVNIGSVSGVGTTPFAGAYCASKAAVHALSDALRLELYPFGIEVVTVQPGGIRSSFGENSMKNLGDYSGRKGLYSQIADFINDRSKLSQQGATDAGKFARGLVNRLEGGKISGPVRIGKDSIRLPLMKRLLPQRVLDALLRKKFGLDEMNL